jgi:hypothetical protein
MGEFSLQILYSRLISLELISTVLHATEYVLNYQKLIIEVIIASHCRPVNYHDIINIVIISKMHQMDYRYGHFENRWNGKLADCVCMNRL